MQPRGPDVARPRGWLRSLLRTSEARSTDVLPLNMPFSRVGAAFVVVCAVLVAGTWWIVEESTYRWLLVCLCQAGSVLVAGAGLALPWRRLPRPLLLGFPLLSLVTLATLPGITDSYATAYNNTFTMAAAFAGVTQRRLVALAVVPAMLPLYLLANGANDESYVRLPVALTTWTVLALVLADLTARHAAISRRLQREGDEARRRGRLDPLTGLPNREVLEDCLDAALQRGRTDGTTCAVFYCDVDDFKDINDGLGHATGDRVLVAVAASLRGLLRAQDIISRVGGDEFVLLVEGVHGPEDAHALGRRLATALNAEHDVDGRPVGVTVSIGLAVPQGGLLNLAADPDDVTWPTSASTAIAAADAAMYEAKQAGGGRCSIWDAESAAAHERRQRTGSDLGRALAEGCEQLWVAYQPIVELASSRLIGVEALARWDHPTRGPVPPDEFVPAAESTGTIADLGRHVLRLAAGQMAAWNEQRRCLGLEPLWVAVNCSPRQLQAAGFVEEVSTLLAEAGLPAERLVLEITESALLEGATVVRRLEELHRRGVVVALDDFGTGYSSLSYLRHLPVQVIKIDRSFVAGLGTIPADEAVVAAVTGIARELGHRVLAEGVETVGQAEAARRLGCLFGQGYLFARPDRPTAFEFGSEPVAARSRP